MSNNIFKSIRNSYITGTLITGLLSNVIVFAQPVEQIFKRESHYTNINYNYISSANTVENVVIAVDKTNDVSTEPVKNSNSTKILKNALSFNAQEKEAVIGVLNTVEKENPRDNFFKVLIPESLNLKYYDALLKYDLYGLESANQTSKSINDNAVYGGSLVKINKKWTSIEEHISTSYLKTGKNEIFFNRRANENYQYRIKNLRIEFVTKRSNQLLLTAPQFDNYNGNLYVVGHAPDLIDKIHLFGQVLDVNNGLFEGIIENVPKNTKDVTLVYQSSNEHLKTTTDIFYHPNDASFRFEEKTENERNSLALLSISNHIKFNNLSLYFDEIGTTTNAKRIQIEGLDFKALKPLNSNLENVTQGKFYGYRTKVNNLRDSSVTTLHINYDVTKIPDGYSDKDVRTFSFDKEKREWIALPVDSLDYENKIIISKYNGDTDYINGVIKVPEMAETSSFTPTTITDMEYANPATGVVSIAPPTPNAMGSASTGFPIKLPKGRNGMMPSIGLNYSSDGGNGWMGVGWNLQLPAITLDTRWGTPRFDKYIETEIYQLNGETLVLQDDDEYTNPHRKDDEEGIERIHSRTFYLRKEGSYLKIQRLGTSISNYRWEVTDKHGNKSIYGNTYDSKINQKLNTGAITHWALKKTIDPFGNYVEYEYDKDIINSEDINGITDVQFFYPKRIKYTLKGSSTTQHHYQVDFSRNTYTLGESTSTLNRTDIGLNARTGSIIATKDLLTEIKISYYDGNINTVRSYRMDYQVSPFNKMQLSKVSEYDTEGKLFYNNTLEYYDEIGNNSIVNGGEVKWYSDPSSLDINLRDLPIPNGSALGTSTSSGFSAGLRGGFGLGYNPASVSVSVGGSYNYSQSKEKTKISFVDINGDGLPDKVYKPSSGGLKYFANLGVNPVNQGVFSQDSYSVGRNNLDETKSRTNGFGFDANAGFIGVGKSQSKTRTDTDGYFTDFNGDGLIDMVSNGVVRFNTTSNWEEPSETSFSDFAFYTPNPISSGIVDDAIIQNLELETLNHLRADHSQFDHVKVWKAPYTGFINIQSIATLIQSNICNDDEYINSFRLTVEKATADQIDGLTSKTSIGSSNEWFLNPSHPTAYINGNISTEIEKGDLFFFRIHNEEYGCGGEIEWNPRITYNDSFPVGDNIDNTTNEHEKNQHIFSAEDDHIVNNGGSWMPSNEHTSISINHNLNFTQYQFSDDVRFIIEKTTNTHVTEVGDNTGQIIEDETEIATWTATYNPNNISSNNISYTLSSPLSEFYTISNQYGSSNSSSADKSYVYRFYVESDSNVQWDQINWQPTITTNFTDVHYPGVNNITYDDNVNQNNYQINGSSFPNVDPNTPTEELNDPLLTISHNMFDENLYSLFLTQFGSGDFPIKINWVVKEKNNSTTKRLHKETFYLHRLQPHIGGWDYEFRTSDTNGLVIDPSSGAFNDYFQYHLSKEKVQEINNTQSKIYTAFYIDYSNFGDNNPANINVLLHPDETENYSFTSQELTSPFIAKNRTFYGTAFRGWGQFLYNGGIKFNYDDEGNIVTEGIGSESDPIQYDGEIDMSVFDFETNSNLTQEDIEDFDSDEDVSLNEVSVRYTFYGQDNEHSLYTNNSIKYTTDEDGYIKYGYIDSNLTASLGRFGESNLYNLWIDPEHLEDPNSGVFVGLKQRSESKGKAKSGNLGIGPASFSGTKSDAKSKVLNQYIDLNGDRYPDIVTDGKIQFTNMNGALYDIRDNTFVSGGESHDETQGVNIAGMFPNSTSSDNNKNSNSTRTNINSGISSSHEEDCYSYNTKQWNDINGDGLTDKVTLTTNGVLVELNTGYGFSNPVIWGGFEGIVASTRSSSGIGASFGNASYAVGFGGGESEANVNTVLIDVNGDGLPDLVKQSGNIYEFYLNNGTNFDSSPYRTFYNGFIDQDYSLTGNVFGSYTYGFLIQIWILTFKATFTATLGGNTGINEKRITVQDIDGDGLPDVLSKGNDNGDITARLNKTGKTNLLKTVHTPLGGTWTIDYKREGNTYKLPQNKWVLNEIRTNDGFDGDEDYAHDETFTTVDYENPNHDRREREFLGFGTVKVYQNNPNNDQPYRYSQIDYHNENVYLKGLQKRSALYAANDTDNPLNESSTVYTIMDADNPVVTTVLSQENNQYLQPGINVNLLDHSRLFVAPVKTISTTYEGTEGLSLEQQFTEYDYFGNLKTYKNLGDTYNNGNDDTYNTTITYYSDSDISGIQNATGFAEKISVYKENGNELLRERSAIYTNQGKLQSISTKLNNENDTNVVTFSYDEVGNLVTSENNFTTTITYDNNLKTFPTKIENTLEEKTTMHYNYLFGVPYYKEDINGKILVTRIDNRGRPIEVISPNELSESNPENQWTIRMQYPGEAESLPSWEGLNDEMLIANGSFNAEDESYVNGTQATAKHHAITRHNVRDYFSNQNSEFTVLKTVSLVDGFGKAIQLKKTLFGNDQLQWLISGKEKKDAYGRVLEAFLPTTRVLSFDVSGYDDNESNLAPATKMTYDIRDRLLTVNQPGDPQAGETETANTEYSISDGMFLTTLTNELGQTFETYSDVKGQQRKTVQNGELTTQFYYNAVGEKTKVRNHQGYDTFYKYDLAGRRTEERHPDHGLQTFKYDNFGNLRERFNSNLLATGSEAGIRYDYDTKNRLVEIRYPNNPDNNVKYTYGLPNNDDAVAQNAVGRLYIQEDASGVQGFAYDDLGNLNDHLRGVAVAGRHTFWYRTRWTYDSFNRIQEIIYPDDEKVRYNYNAGGTLNNITRSISGTAVLNESIISEIHYNQIGERIGIKYGNNTKTTYTYDERRRLKNLNHQFGSADFGITNDYKYDALSNVTELKTNEQLSNLGNISGRLAGPIEHNYRYDDYNRLISADGRYVGPNDLGTDLLAQEYTLRMKYDLAHNITLKTQTHIQGAVTDYNEAIESPEIMTKTNYSLSYDAYATGVNVVPNGSGDEYGYVQPHAPREIIETPDDSGSLHHTDPNVKKKLIDYDANGNQLSITQVVNEDEELPAIEGVVQNKKMMLHKNIWDEEDRLRAVDLNPEEKDKHQLAVYTYDANGQRTVRYIPGRLDVKSNAKNTSANERDEVMIYPSGLISAKPVFKLGNTPQEGDLISKYTKHYYIGSERINSRLGSTKDLGLYPYKVNPRFPGIRDLANENVSQANNAMANTFTVLEQSISLNSVAEEDIIKKSNGFSHEANANDAYWYHSDHLGSSSYITDVNGNVTQHMEYLPFGETLVEEHQNSYNTPYKFNAKELDDETGNYYYGARYYNPKFSIWLSVDPLAEQMPSWSSYNYNFSNPIKYHDPTGMAPETSLDDSDDWVRKKGSKDEWVWDESVTTKEQAEAKGLDYGGKNTDEVKENWGFNTTDGLEGWWNRISGKGHGQVFDSQSYYDAKLPEIIQMMFNKWKYKNDLIKNKIKNSTFKFEGKLERIIALETSTVGGNLLLSDENFNYTAYLSGATDIFLNDFGYVDVHDRANWTLVVGNTGSTISGKYFYLTNDVIGRDFPIITIKFDSDENYNNVKKWFRNNSNLDD